MAGPGDGLSMAEGRASMDEVPFSVPGAAVSCRGKTALVQQWWVSPKALPPLPLPFVLASLLDPTFRHSTRCVVVYVFIFVVGGGLSVKCVGFSNTKFLFHA